MDKEFCPTCGLEYRHWAIKIEESVCEECKPKEFNDLYKHNLTHMKRKKLGQEHITEHTWFPKIPSAADSNRKILNRREQK